MKKFVVFSVLTLACVSLLWIPRARTAPNNQAEIRRLLDRWAKAFRAKDLNGIMSCSGGTMSNATSACPGS